MTQWSGDDRWRTRTLRDRIRASEWQCLRCKPNRGENEGRRDGKYLWPDATFRPSKSKDNK
jgi:hypothetical protein